MRRVSIIMSAYNKEAYIRQAIQSVCDQSYPHWELIISDDGSTDGTVRIIEEFLHDQRIKLFRQPKNLGYIANKNFAFTQATGDLLTQLDADDLCPPQRLERQLVVFQDQDIHVCGTNYELVDSNGMLTATHKRYDTDMLVSTFDGNYPFWFPSLMFTRKVLNEFGLFSDYFSGIVGDDEYWTYRVNAKYPIYFIKDCLYSYRIHGSSLSAAYNKPRQLIVAEILTELYRQRMETGTDFIEQGHPEKMQAFETAVLSDKQLMAEKYRTWAAKAVDHKEFKTATILLKKAVSLNGVNKGLFRTFIYYMNTRRKRK